MNGKRIQMILYIVIFSVSIIVPTYNNVCMLVIIGINVMFMLANKSIELSVVSTAIMGNETYSLLNAILCLLCVLIIKPSIISKKINKLKIAATTGTAIIIILLNSLVNGLINDTIINVLFYTFYLIVLLICYMIIKETLRIHETVIATKMLILVELIATIIRVVIVKNIKPGDYYSGTLNNAHFFGNWIVLTGIALVAICFEKKNTQKKGITKVELLLYLAIMAFMLYLADAKQIILSFAIAVIAYAVMQSVSYFKANCLWWTFIGMYIGFYVLIWLLSIEPVRIWIQNVDPVHAAYLYTTGWNGRFLYYYGTLFESMTGFMAIFGYGLGQYGSRISNLFAYNVMYRSNNFINNSVAKLFLPHYIEQYAKYVRYYSDAFVKQIRYRSAVLSYPFSSFVSLLSETGFFGVIFIANWINRHFKSSKAGFIIVFFLSNCIFDIYFDNFQCIICALVYISILSIRTSDKDSNAKQSGYSFI